MVMGVLVAIELIRSFYKTIHKGACYIRKHRADHFIKNDVLKLPMKIELDLTSVLTQCNETPLPSETLKGAIDKLHIN